jgi:hypothetical protein
MTALIEELSSDRRGFGLVYAGGIVIGTVIATLLLLLIA